MPIGTKDYDALITDIGQKERSHKIFGIQYLSNAYYVDAAHVVQRVNGMIGGRNRRCLITLTAKLEENTKWVHFLFEIGSSRTYISQQVSSLKAFFNADLVIL